MPRIFDISREYILFMFIEYFKAIQKTLQDDSLISIIQEQIVQGEKMIQFYHLKDRSEKVKFSYKTTGGVAPFTNS